MQHFRSQNAKFYCRQGGMQSPKPMNTYKFRLKRAAFLAHQMQTFLGQADDVILKIMHTCRFRLK